MEIDQLTRITEALYRVTDLMPDEEPLKWRLRGKAISIMELSLKLGEKLSLKERIDVQDGLKKKLEEVSRLLEISSAAAFISRINFEVIQREYRTFSNSLPQVEGPQLFFPEHHEKISAPEPSAQLFVNTEKNQVPPKEPSPPSLKVISRAIGQSKHPVIKNEDRRERILSFLKAHSWASRGDILAIFEDEISEKTLQRELTDLLESGLITKTGEKRWCRYALKR